MCGIAGIVRCNAGDALSVDALRSLLIGLEARGADAAGVALQQANGAIAVWKGPVPGHEIAGQEAFLTWADARTASAVAALVHTRAWTTGPPSENDNNHPLIGPHAVMVHNGMISNHAERFKELGLKRIGAVDSDILRAILEKHDQTEAAAQVLETCEGSAAILGLDSRHPGQMFVARDISPLWMAPVGGQMWFASTPEVLKRASAKWHWFNGFWFAARPALECEPRGWGNYAGVFGPEGLQWRKPWETAAAPITYGKWPRKGAHAWFV